MKKLFVFALILTLLLSACAAANENPPPTETNTTEKPLTSPDTVSPEETPEDTDDAIEEYIEPYINYGGISWINNLPTKSAAVFIIDSFDATTRTFIAERGYFQKPVGIDLYDYSYQFQLMRLRWPGEFAFANSVDIYLDENADETTRSNDLDAFEARLAEGYNVWAFEAVDGEITTLYSIPWRERIVYEVLEPITDAIQISVQALREVTYPQLEGTRRLESIGLAPETLAVTDATQVFTDKFYVAVDDADYGAECAPGTAEELTAWYNGGGRFLLVERSGAEVVSVYGMYSA